MQTPSRISVIRILFMTALVFVLFLSSHTWRIGHAYTTISQTIPESRLDFERGSMSTLNVASRIYVINLPKRTRRRLDMERLRYSLGLDFTYVNGTEADGETVHRIMAQVLAFRALANSQQPPPAFVWPQGVDTLVESEFPLGMKGSDLWPSNTVNLPDPYASEPLICAHDNSTLDLYSPQTPPYRLLTKERLACWHSHWRVIRLIADGQEDVSLVLEDDVDIELDIRQRLRGVWNSLPSAWDIVFLGTLWQVCPRNTILTDIQVTVGLTNPKDPQLPPTIPRFRTHTNLSHLFIRPLHRSVHTHTHYRKQVHDDWRYTFDILLLHTLEPSTRRSHGWWKAESSGATRSSPVW